jgi:hypothetical protein
LEDGRGGLDPAVVGPCGNALQHDSISMAAASCPSSTAPDRLHPWSAARATPATSACCRPGSLPGPSSPLYADKCLASRGRHSRPGARCTSLFRRWPCPRRLTACILAVRRHPQSPGSTCTTWKPWPYRDMAAVPDGWLSMWRRGPVCRMALSPAVARHQSRKPVQRPRRPRSRSPAWPSRASATAVIPNGGQPQLDQRLARLATFGIG